ncbi:General secretion pathway protein GspF [Tenacibaculum maritimum]|uniref:type II secretion system F family protein n=1 Tax=Tenacibaculum maritimum TaxID=107401 RepID=UPI0012E56172|nr:type II secretion system F family protein [Tenacibaculum maritimum]CAA0143661.1 General secretion pathway protein GspF [Tenacibaculum maritimum]CAA0201399.1 General secretion pathway protein GspF [Tenacibaculum maritimum]CAA0204736.1 General secretion pathway protein GspF [Tenacibaculum maritimum]
MNSLEMKINAKDYRNRFKANKKRQSVASYDDLFKLSISDKRKSSFYRELEVLLKSGVTIEESLSILLAQTKTKSLRKAIEPIYEELLKGKSLVSSMERTGSFSSFETNTIAIGEETKNLPKVLAELQVFYEGKHKLKNQIVTVLTYPIFVIIITVAVLIFMLRNVVPMFEKVFKQFNSELPNLTKKVIYLSNNFSYFFLSFIIFALLIVVFHIKYRRKSTYRDMSSKVVLKIPFFGKMIQLIYLSRFCRALSLLLSSKVSLVESLSFVKAMIGFYPIESSIDEIKKSIMKGGTLGNGLKKHKIYDLNLVSMVKVSEEINELDEMFSYLAEQYNNEVETKSKRIGVLIEPLIIIIIGGLVGVIMIAMYLPMFDLSKILNSN